MRFLIVEDDFVSRRVLHKLVSRYGECDVAMNGKEALEAYGLANEENLPYQTILLDICMPKVDGLKVLKRIRQTEKDEDHSDRTETHIIMTTAMDDSKHVMKAYYEGGASGYLTKPITRPHLEAEFKKLNILPGNN